MKTKMNQLFEKNSVDAKMNDEIVLVNVGRIFESTVISVVNTLNGYGVETGDYKWNDGLNAWIIPLI